ncbi:MAG: zinc ribbon domain-containing protein [Candidatus Eisenbacteria bacterium]|nr:zinc ribbon domain-containing protein [Candidatus Eisenbacteria bacterium]
MPTYEYECKKCGYVFEVFQSMTAEPLTTCPKCFGKLVRLPGAGAGIIFKGSGFYATDYRTESYRRGAKGEGPGRGRRAGRAGKAADGDGKASTEPTAQDKREHAEKGKTDKTDKTDK